MTDEQVNMERQDRLIEQHCKDIEAGKKPFYPLQSLKLPPSNKCPACGSTMSWYPARQAFLCVKEGCQ